MKYLKKRSSGAVLVEFAFASLFFVMLLLSTLEWTVEMFARHSTERGLTAALRSYAEISDADGAQDAFSEETAFFISRCIQPLDIRLYDSISGVDLTDRDSGYSPTGTAVDDNAVVARITATCEWDRMTPLTAAVFGKQMVHSASAVARIR